jgi:hypothetical protein
MNKKIKILLALLLIGGIAAFFVYKFVKKPVPDNSDVKSTALVSFQEFNSWDATNNGIAKMQNQVITVEGNLASISDDDSLVSIILGDTSTTNTIICQADNRHLEDFRKASLNETIKIKGTCTGYQPNDEMDLGASLQLKNCVLDK